MLFFSLIVSILCIFLQIYGKIKYTCINYLGKLDQRKISRIEFIERVNMDEILLVSPNKDLENQAIDYKQKHFSYGETEINGSELWNKKIRKGYTTEMLRLILETAMRYGLERLQLS
jgi:hypothetical protein